MATLYLICFCVGFILVVVFAVFGGTHVGHELHLHVDHSGSSLDIAPSPFNTTTILGFLTGFGGIGYVFTRFGTLPGMVILLIALVVGVLVAGFLFLVLIKVFIRGERVMREEEYDLTGMLGRVSISVPPGGVGEVKYVLDGSTRSIGARTRGTKPIHRGTEVVILSIERGIATVCEYEALVHGEALAKSEVKEGQQDTLQDHTEVEQ